MNKIFTLIIGVLFMASCNAGPKEKAESKTDKSAPVVETSVSTATATAGEVVHLTTETFKQKVFNYDANQEWKYEGTVPCIVDFYADWCGPCKRVAPILEELAKEYEGKIIIYKVNTEEQRELSAAFGISSIPTILFIPADGKPQAAQGALPKETFIKAIEEVLLQEKKSS